MPNRPGALSRLTQLIAEQAVNIVGIASEVRDDSGVVRLAVADGVDLSGVLSKNGLASIETKLVSVEVPDRPGELSRIAKALAEGNINITTVYGTAFGQNCRILFAAENTEKILKILERL